MSIRVKFVLLCLASIAALGFVLASVTYFSVRNVEERMMRQAKLLAKNQAEEIKTPILEIIRNKEEIDIEQALKNFLHENKSAMGENQNILSIKIRTGSGEDYTEYKFSRSGDTLEITQNGNSEDSVKIDLFHNESEQGEIELQMSRGEILSQIETYGSNIRNHSLVLTMALFILMVLTFLFLWNLFQHYIELVQEKEKQQNMAYVGTLAAGLAHEIRNPLNAMNLNLEMIREEIVDPRDDSKEKNLEMVQLLQDESRQLNHTLTNFLNFALPKHSHMEPCDLSEILNDTLALIQPQLRQNEVKLETEMPRSIIIEGNPESLRQVFLNLLLNAIQAMEKQNVEKQLKLLVKAEPPKCRLLVRDSGPGIPEKNLEKVFEAFFTTKPAGSGFGLAIAKRIISDHKGSIHILESTAQGTAFEIVLPLDANISRSKPD